MGVILFGIYIVLSIVLTVIGVFIGNIIFFDSSPVRAALPYAADGTPGVLVC